MELLHQLGTIHDQTSSKYILILLKHYPHLLYVAEPELSRHKVISGFKAEERCPGPGFRAVVLKLEYVELRNMHCWAPARRVSETVELAVPWVCISNKVFGDVGTAPGLYLENC